MNATPETPNQIGEMLARISSGRVPLAPDAILRQVEQPCWETAARSSDWRTYIPLAMREDWERLSLTTRLYAFEAAELAALQEAVGRSTAGRPEP